MKNYSTYMLTTLLLFSIAKGADTDKQNQRMPTDLNTLNKVATKFTELY